jgi:hypothetical protein
MLRATRGSGVVACLFARIADGQATSVPRESGPPACHSSCWLLRRRSAPSAPPKGRWPMACMWRGRPPSARSQSLQRSLERGSSYQGRALARSRLGHSRFRRSRLRHSPMGPGSCRRRARMRRRLPTKQRSTSAGSATLSPQTATASRARSRRARGRPRAQPQGRRRSRARRGAARGQKARARAAE